jgi:RNA polymerase sigma factor (TIGR02999 family)
MSDTRGLITRLAERWGAGDREAFDRLVELAYEDLRRIAHRHLRSESRDAVLDTTALVHEAYLKLAAVEEGSWRSRAHFFAFCSKAMRRILIDHARRQGAGKRGGGRIRIPLTPEVGSTGDDTTDLLSLNDALERLEARDPRMAQIVEYRFFGGMSVPEAAEALDVSPRTVERDWTRARAYLYQALTENPEPPPDG